MKLGEIPYTSAERLKNPQIGDEFETLINGIVTISERQGDILTVIVGGDYLKITLEDFKKQFGPDIDDYEQT